jgi:hypothetical protein
VRRIKTALSQPQAALAAGEELLSDYGDDFWESYHELLPFWRTQQRVAALEAEMVAKDRTIEVRCSRHQ